MAAAESQLIVPPLDKIQHLHLVIGHVNHIAGSSKPNTRVETQANVFGVHEEVPYFAFITPQDYMIITSLPTQNKEQGLVCTLVKVTLSKNHRITTQAGDKLNILAIRGHTYVIETKQKTDLKEVCYSLNVGNDVLINPEADRRYIVQIPDVDSNGVTPAGYIFVRHEKKVE